MFNEVIEKLYRKNQEGKYVWFDTRKRETAKNDLFDDLICKQLGFLDIKRIKTELINGYPTITIYTNNDIKKVYDIMK